MNVEDVTFNVKLASDWLCNSGVQNREGGFYAWYDVDKAEYSFVYPEVTAYAVQVLIRLHMKGESSCLDHALKAGDWLLSIQKGDGSFWCKRFDKISAEHYDDSFYVFDAGIIVGSFLDLHGITSRREYLSAAVKTANLMLNFQNSNGSFKAGRNSDGSFINNPHWSQTSSCHHTKLAIPLLRLYKATKQERYLDAAQRLLHWSENLQLPTGRFLAFQGSNVTYMHAHCYALESLLCVSNLLDEETNSSIARRARLGVDWLLTAQNKDGSMWNWNGSHENKIKVNDALAQTLRIFLLSKNIPAFTNKNKAIDLQLRTGLSFLKKMQYQNENRHLNGGISYSEANGEHMNHVSTCATVFAVHAELLREPVVTEQLIEVIF